GGAGVSRRRDGPDPLAGEAVLRARVPVRAGGARVLPDSPPRAPAHQRARARRGVPRPRPGALRRGRAARARALGDPHHQRHRRRGVHPRRPGPAHQPPERHARRVRRRVLVRGRVRARLPVERRIPGV
ncbi:MAG: hypothetical protein AVDCRST_MAG40-607, partial [uncultured Gemmatimonadaceae bacterium]